MAVQRQKRRIVYIGERYKAIETKSLAALKNNVLGLFGIYTTCIFHLDKELIECLGRTVEAGGNFSFAEFNRNNLPNFWKNNRAQETHNFKF